MRDGRERKVPENPLMTMLKGIFWPASAKNQTAVAMVTTLACAYKVQINSKLLTKGLKAIIAAKVPDTFGWQKNRNRD